MSQAIELFERRGYQKVGYLSREVGLGVAELSSILGLGEGVVVETMRDGVVADRPDRAETEDRFFMLLILFDYLLNLSGQDFGELSRLWRVAPASHDSIYSSATVKPPWYESGIRDYLREHRLVGLEACITWIRTY